MSTTIPALSSVTDILDSDLVMVTHSNGESFKIAGSEINKRNQAVIASGTTLTGAPLKTGNIVRVYFTADITGSNTSTGLTLNYNGVNKSVKVPKNGTLANFVASDLGGSPTVYKYLQAHTTLELLYDGTQFIIIGNPVVLSSSDYTIYADGHFEHNLYNLSTEILTNKNWAGRPIYRKGIEIGNVGSGQTVEIDHNISNLGAFLFYNGMVADYNNTTYPLPFCAISSIYNIQVLLNSTKLSVSCGSGISIRGGHFFVYYFKS